MTTAELPQTADAPGRSGRRVWLWATFVAIVVAAAANWGAWRAAVNPDAELQGLWLAMETVRMPDRPDVAPAFPDEIRAQEGRRVSLSGVAFLSAGGVRDGSVQWCVLMPRGRYGCCGVSCDPRPELSVYVDCGSAPWPADGRTQVLATVEGTLRLERDGGSWCLYALEDAVVRAEAP